MPNYLPAFFSLAVCLIAGGCSYASGSSYASPGSDVSTVSDALIPDASSPNRPKISVDLPYFRFLNASPTAPPTARFRFGNTGAGPLIFHSATLEQSTGTAYAIVKQPNKGATIPPLGQGNNRAATPMGLDVCIRLTSAGTTQDYNEKLLIKTNDPEQKQVEIALSAAWSKQSRLQVQCDAKDTALTFDFNVKTAEITQKCCTIINAGPAGVIVSKTAITALNQTKQPLVDAVFKAKLLSISAKAGTTGTTGKIAQVKLLRSISAKMVS